MRTLMVCRTGMLAILLTAMGVTAHASQATQPGQPAESTSPVQPAQPIQPAEPVQHVQFMASVVDAGGAAVTTLDVDDLSVTAGTNEWPIVGFDPIEWPTKVVIAVDNGTNMRGSIGDLRAGLKALIQELPAGVEASLLTTAPQPRTIQPSTLDKGALLQAVDLIAPDDGSPHFVEALTEAAKRFDSEEEMARGGVFPIVIIVGTTGVDGSQYNEYHLVRMMRSYQRRSATVHVVMLSNGAVALGGNQTNIGINVTKLTGGRYEGITASSRLRTLLPEIGKQVARSAALQRHQYLITVQRPGGQSGPIQQLVVRSKSGYRMRLSRDGHMP